MAWKEMNQHIAYAVFCGLLGIPCLLLLIGFWEGSSWDSRAVLGLTGGILCALMVYFATRKPEELMRRWEGPGKPDPWAMGVGLPWQVDAMYDEADRLFPEEAGIRPWDAAIGVSHSTRAREYSVPRDGGWLVRHGREVEANEPTSDRELGDLAVHDLGDRYVVELEGVDFPSTDCSIELGLEEVRVMFPTDSWFKAPTYFVPGQPERKLLTARFQKDIAPIRAFADLYGTTLRMTLPKETYADYDNVRESRISPVDRKVDPPPIPPVPEEWKDRPFVRDLGVLVGPREIEVRIALDTQGRTDMTLEADGRYAKLTVTEGFQKKAEGKRQIRLKDTVIVLHLPEAIDGQRARPIRVANGFRVLLPRV